MKRIRTWAKKHAHAIVVDLLIVGAALGLLAAGAILIWIATLDIPNLSSFEERRVLQSTKIYDRTGEVLLYDLHQDVRRTIVPYEDISRHIKNATVAIEDDTFFEHSGIRPMRTLKAVFDNIVSGDLLGGQGGSTITQQVIKNSILEREKTVTRKIKEWILALRLEQVLTKEEILGHYLNESPYGGTIYGVEEASLSFFGKSAADVSLAEAAYLASLPQLPTFYSPYGNNVAALEERKNLVLERMLINGFISQEEHDAARNERVEFRPQSATGIRAPHFVFYIREQLVNRYGEESLAEMGLKVITTLDWELQEKAEEIVKRKALYNDEAFNAENAALVATDPQTGEILVMVGSRDYFDTEIDGNYNIALAERQPGSAFKPFVYATAFKKGYTPETVVFDLRTQFSTNCAPDNFTSENGCYSPVNYDNKFRGPVTFRNALAQSLNIPAVKALYLAGINESLKTARDLGITTLTNAEQYGLTLVLGGGEVKLLEMVDAYGAFANEGVRSSVRGILRIEDNTGTVIEETQPVTQRVIDRDISLQISDILSDNVARTPLFGANSSLYFPGRDVAAKTGTTNDKRDAWVVGYTPNLVVGAWAGNNDNTSMNEISGLIITPLWREFMDAALAKIPEKTFATPPRTPDNIKPVLRGIWFDPAELVTDSESGGATLEVTQAILGAHSILYFVNKDDPRGPAPTNQTDPQFPLWEYPVSLWKAGLIGSVQSQNTENPDDE
jgi:1A family penicillin-binding protein